jgi:hypothetical protein
MTSREGQEEAIVAVRKATIGLPTAWLGRLSSVSFDSYASYRSGFLCLLPDNACRTEFTPTRSKQTIPVPLTRHKIRGGAA